MEPSYNDLKDLELTIEAAEHVIGQATSSMDEDQLKAANDALNDAKMKLNNALRNRTGVDDEFLKTSQQLIERAEEQLKEAMED